MRTTFLDSGCLVLEICVPIYITPITERKSGVILT